MSTSTTKPVRQTIGANVRRLMAVRGMNQAALAKASGENEMYVSRVCRGVVEPSASKLHRIAVALRVKMEFLLKSENVADSD